MTSERLRWSDGAIVAPAGGRRAAVSTASTGRLWITSGAALARVVAWVADPGDPPPPLAAKLRDAGILVDDPNGGEPFAPSPTLAYHRWSERDDYADGADELAERRREVLGKFEAPTRRAILNLARSRPAPDPLPSDLIDVVWHATDRARLYRRIVRSDGSAAALLYSYGAAYDLYVLDPGAPTASVLLADLDARGRGAAVDADATDVLRSVGVNSAHRGVAVVGRLEDFQLRYHHAKALRGFLVDGGRMLAEVGRAMQRRFPDAWLSRAPLGAPTCRALRLDPATHVAIGISFVRSSTETG